MRIADRIETKLRAALTPARLVVTDESSLHAGHAGAMPGGETHFRVEIVSAAFEGLSRVARHRMVHTLLAEEFRDGVHALTLTLATPPEI